MYMVWEDGLQLGGLIYCYEVSDSHIRDVEGANGSGEYSDLS